MQAVLYLSKANQALSKDELKVLEKVSSANNKKLDLSGYLYYDGTKFLQYLEGEPEVLNKLLETIRQDPRHTFLCEAREEIQEKRFPQWHMKNIQSMVLELGLVEKTIIQTLSIFVDKGYSLDAHISKDLFKLMDHLKVVTF